MTKSVFLLLFALPWVNAAKAQKDTTVFYMNKSYQVVVKKDSASFIRRLISVDTNKYKIINVQDYYMNGKLKLITQSTPLKAVTRNCFEGPSIEFYESGNKKRIANYKDDKIVGDEVNYYPNRKVYNIINYDHPNYHYLKECHDSTGAVIAEDGNGKWIAYDDDFKNIVRTGPIKDGRPDGEWKGWAVNGILQTGVYANGRAISGKPYQDELDNIIFEKVDVLPIFGMSQNDFIQFLGKTIRYPMVDLENNIQGQVIVTFVVEKDGSLTDIKAIKEPDKTLTNEGIRAVKLSPPWTPAQKDGCPVRCRVKYPVNFSITVAR